MQISLDYYRILGLPMQATAEQLEQAHRDRTLQLPRREYSDFAIQSRKQLIDSAYAALQDSGQRQAYDTQLLAAGSGSDSVTISIHEDQLIGALLILLELGEYELVIRLGRPYLSSGSNEFQGKEQAVLSDVVLTIGLACLELGREQWQQHQYENAAESLATGQELMVRERLFPEMQTDIQADLNKLKPYRILELVARPLSDQSARQQGIALLKSMLEARGGIDGAHDDASGLSVEDFLRFVQQLRSYLTSAEQQNIFEAESQRPSSVGTYLSVYALLARGFAKHQPNLVRQAKQRLALLTERQDVHLEQAVCAVLLGQTEEATYALERSHENEPLMFIKSHSEGAPDLLPGLCLYTERWLQQDVFPFFRDLDQSSVTLKEYFANQQVQAYLESIPPNDGGDLKPLGAPTSGFMNDRGLGGLGTAAGLGAAGLGAAGLGAAGLGAAGLGAAGLGSATGLGAAGAATNGPPAYTAEQVSSLSPDGGLDDASLGATPELDDPLDKSRRRTSPKWGRLALLLLLGLLGLGLLGFIAMQVLGLFGGLFGGPRLNGDPLDIELSRPAVDLPAEGSNSGSATNTSPEAIVDGALRSWYAAKAKAMGPDWDRSALAGILLEPSLSEWTRRSEGSERDGAYVEYEQTFEILSSEATDDNQVTATVSVEEIADVFQDGTLDNGASYREQLTIDYRFEQQNNQWMIESFSIR